jgi:hypothetical protein
MVVSFFLILNPPHPSATRAPAPELLGPDDYAAFVESTHVLESFWNDGTLGYGIIAAAKPA